MSSPPVMPKTPPMPLMAQHIYEDTRFILGMENGPREQWQVWQRKRLEEMLKWLVQMPHWAEYLKPVMKHGVIDMYAYDRWDEMPVMGRSNFRHLIETYRPSVPRPHGALRQYDTSGSTGQPVTFWYSEIASRVIESHYWADGRRQGRPIDCNALVLNAKGSPADGEDQVRPPDPWLHAGRFLARHSPSFTAEQNAVWITTKANELSSNGKMISLTTYPALLSSILAEMESGKVPGVHIDQVITSAETVEPELRTRVRSVLGASVRDRYSCEEVGPIAFQCPRSDDYLHVAVMNVIAEVADDRGRRVPWGTQGNVLLTGLHQWASPALRYEVGDIASMLQSCPGCGVHVPVFTQLLGRKRSLVKRSNGDVKYVRILSNHWLECAPIREHRVVQVEPLRFEVELVAESILTREQLAALDAMLHRMIGEEFAFDIIEREVIAWPPGRKRQEMTSLVP